MPLFCTRCGAPIASGSRFCEQCGVPVEVPPSLQPCIPFIPLLELHEGALNLKRTPAMMEITSGELRIYRLPEYFNGEIEDLRSRLDDAWMVVSDQNGDWKAKVTSWNWNKEPLITAIAGNRDGLEAGGKGLVILEVGGIRSIMIEHVESDTVWDIMTIDYSGKKVVIDITGPVVWHAFGLLSSMLGEKVSYEEE
ncbi:MAG: zinc ribbon domain-containing protein [Methanoregulaceae archaeon]|nr:zinc ribbon domain-containing protein [Methanoregulaceae archaeon]